MKTPDNKDTKPSSPRRAKGQTQTSISISQSILEAAREAAAKEKRSLSQWLELLLEDRFKPGLSLAEDHNESSPSLGNGQSPIKYPKGRARKKA